MKHSLWGDGSGLDSAVAAYTAGDDRRWDQRLLRWDIIGTMGPWILVLAIVWFFILRQMRSPGGSGGVLSFGRSRAALYTKENIFKADSTTAVNLVGDWNPSIEPKSAQ